MNAKPRANVVRTILQRPHDLHQTIVFSELLTVEIWIGSRGTTVEFHEAGVLAKRFTLADPVAVAQFAEVMQRAKERTAATP